MDMIGDFEPPENFVDQYVTGARNGVVVLVVSQSTLTVTMQSWDSEPPLPDGTVVIDPKMGEVDVNSINLLGSDQAVLQAPPSLSMVPGGTLNMRGLTLPPAQDDIYQVRVLARYETDGRSVEEVETEWVVEQDCEGPQPKIEFTTLDFWPVGGQKQDQRDSDLDQNHEPNTPIAPPKNRSDPLRGTAEVGL